jgi:hypothetical protein
MMMADVEDIWRVAGKSMAIAPTGPIPGRTPIKVPIKTPKKQDNRFKGWSPIEKPYRRLLKTPICSALSRRVLYLKIKNSFR